MLCFSLWQVEFPCLLKNTSSSFKLSKCDYMCVLMSILFVVQCVSAKQHVCVCVCLTCRPSSRAITGASSVSITGAWWRHSAAHSVLSHSIHSTSMARLLGDRESGHTSSEKNVFYINISLNYMHDIWAYSLHLLHLCPLSLNIFLWVIWLQYNLSLLLLLWS